MDLGDSKYKVSGKRVQKVRKELDGSTIFRKSGGKYPIKLNQDDFAEIVGINSNLYNSIESGRRRLTRENAEKISEIAQIPTSVEWLMGENVPRNHFDKARIKLSESERREVSHQSSVIILEDAAKRMGLTLTTFIDPQIENESILAYCDTVTDSAKARYIAFSLHRGDDELDQVLECASLFKIQKRLSRYAEFLISEAIEEGSGIDGEQ